MPAIPCSTAIRLHADPSFCCTIGMCFSQWYFMSNLAPGRFGYSTLTFITARSLLASLEARLALFVERGDALAAVLGRDHAVIGFDLEHHAAREVHLQPVMDRMLGLAHRNRR